MIAVQLFNGKFFYCTDTSKHVAADCQVIIIIAEIIIIIVNVIIIIVKLVKI